MMMPPFAFGLTGDVGVFLIIIFEVIYITIYTWIYIKIKGTLRTMVDIIGDGYLGDASGQIEAVLLWYLQKRLDGVCGRVRSCSRSGQEWKNRQQ